MSKQGTSFHHRIFKEIFYSGLVRVQLLFFFLALAPLLAIKILFLFHPGDIESVVNFLILCGLCLGIIVSFLYILTQYSSVDKTLKPVTQMAEVGKMAAGVAHDIRSPLSSMNAALEQLNSLSVDHPQYPEILHLLDLSSKRLSGIADDLLKRQKGSAPKKELFFLHKVLDDLVAEYTAQSQYQGVDFSRQYDLQDVELYGSRVGLQRVFGNIVKNAVEAMDFKGSVTLRTELKDHFVTVTIADTGPGMCKEKLERVLMGGHSEGKKDGHGIGLAVVRETVAKWKGRFWAESKEGEGTAFFIQLPLAADCHPEPCQRRGEGSPMAKSEGYTVLVIDDDKVIRLGWELMKERLSIKALHAFESLESLKEAELDCGAIDIAFVDKNIEESQFSVVETLGYLKEKIPSGKIVLASGESEEELRQDPSLQQADFIVTDKIPTSFKEFFS